MGSCQIDPQEESQVRGMNSRQQTKNTLSHWALLKMKAAHWLFCNTMGRIGARLSSYYDS